MWKHLLIVILWVSSKCNTQIKEMVWCPTPHMKAYFAGKERCCHVGDNLKLLNTFTGETHNLFGVQNTSALHCGSGWRQRRVLRWTGQRCRCAAGLHVVQAGFRHGRADFEVGLSREREAVFEEIWNCKKAEQLSQWCVYMSVQLLLIYLIFFLFNLPKENLITAVPQLAAI